MDMYDKRVRVSHTYRAQRGYPFGNPGGEAARMSAGGAHVAATRPGLAERWRARVAAAEAGATLFV
jgi:hypothetical protein